MTWLRKKRRVALPGAPEREGGTTLEPRRQNTAELDARTVKRCTACGLEFVPKQPQHPRCPVCFRGGAR